MFDDYNWEDSTPDYDLWEEEQVFQDHEGEDYDPDDEEDEEYYHVMSDYDERMWERRQMGLDS